MALTVVQQNILSQIQQLAERLSEDQATMTRLTAMWTNEFPTPPTTADIQALSEFAHVTQTELTDAAGALVAVSNTLGVYATPTSNINKLAKIVSR